MKTLTLRQFFYTLVKKSAVLCFVLLILLTVLLLLKDLGQKISEQKIQLNFAADEIKRTIEGELYLDNSESIEYVKKTLEQKYHVNEIRLAKFGGCKITSGPLIFSLDLQVCTTTNFGSSKPNYSISVIKKLTYRPSSSFVYFFIGSLLSVVLFSSFLFYSLLKLIKAAIVDPLQAVGKNPESEVLVGQPISEVIELSERLRSFIKEHKKAYEREAFYHLAIKVAHDMRSPLSALKMIQGTLPIGGTQVTLLSRAIDRIEFIANDILDRNRFQLSVEQYFDINQAILDIVEEKKIGGATAVITFENDNSPLSTRGSTGDFKRVVSNIIQNAIEASPVGATVIVTTTRLGNVVKVSVSDEGPGFSTSLIGKIGKAPISEGKQNGSGIGLYSAYQYATEVSGSLQIKTSEKGGAEVVLSLPLTLNKDFS